MRILIIESQPGAGSPIARALASHPAFVMQIVSLGDYKLQPTSPQGVDAVVIEANTESARGITVRLRQAQYPLPVLVVSSATDRSSVAALIEAGADDCITKPLHSEEFLSRLIALIRRSRGYASSRIDVGDLTLDMNQGRVFREGSAFELSPEEYRLLEYLALRHGEAISTKEIAVEVFGTNQPHDDVVVDQIVARVSRRVVSESGPIIESTSPHRYRISS